MTDTQMAKFEELKIIYKNADGEESWINSSYNRLIFKDNFENYIKKYQKNIDYLKGKEELYVRRYRYYSPIDKFGAFGRLRAFKRLCAVQNLIAKLEL